MSLACMWWTQRPSVVRDPINGSQPSKPSRDVPCSSKLFGPVVLRRDSGEAPAGLWRERAGGDSTTPSIPPQTEKNQLRRIFLYHSDLAISERRNRVAASPKPPSTRECRRLNDE